METRRAFPKSPGPHGTAAALLAVLAVLLPLVTSPAFAADPQITVLLQPDTIGVDEAATLQIEVASSGLSAPLQGQPDFQLENLEIVQGPSRSESFRFVNGRTSRSLTFRWRLRPSQVGPARVRAIRLLAGEQAFALPDQEIQVQEQATGAVPQAPSDPFGDMFDPFGRRRREPRAPAYQPKLFLRAVAEPARPYAGQQVLYTVYLYTQADISAVAPRDLPTFQGFWAMEVPQPERQARPDMVVEEEERYARVVLLQKALFPLQPGHLEIPAFTVDLGVRVAEPTTFGLTSSVEEVRRKTAPVAVEVQPLPPAPADFSGAVGRLDLDARLEPRELEAGQAATLTLTLAGQGHLAGLPDPDLPEIENLRVFPPQKEGKEEVTGTTVRGRRSWSYVLVPEREGVFDLPALAIPYFDPAAGGYATASTPALQLTARPAADAVAATAVPAAAPDAGSPAAVARPNWRRYAPWAAGTLGGVALLAVGAALIRRGRPAAGSTNPSTSRAPRRALREALRNARHEVRPRQAAAAIEEAWRDYLHQRWNLPPGTPSPQWRELLSARGAEPALAAALQSLADDLHYLRYAPQLSSAEALRAELLERSLRLVRSCR